MGQSSFSSQSVRIILTHESPHLDERVAINLLRKHGDEKFPGVSDAEIRLSKDESGANFDDHLGNGTLPVGVAGGIFDEHPRNGGEEKVGESAASLVAKELGLLSGSNSALSDFLSYVTHEDNHGDKPHMFFSVAQTVKAFNRFPLFKEKHVQEWVEILVDANRQYPDTFPTDSVQCTLEGEFELEMLTDSLKREFSADEDQSAMDAIEYVMDQLPKAVHPYALVHEARRVEQAKGTKAARNWLLYGLNALVARQHNFETALCELEEEAEAHRVTTSNGHSVGIIEIQSDNPEIVSAAMSRRGGDVLPLYNPADIVVVEKSSGNIQIMTNSHHEDIPFVRIIQSVRLAECLEQREVCRDPDTLATEGEFQKWFYHEELRALLNGSGSFPEKEPTALPREEVTELVISAIKSGDSGLSRRNLEHLARKISG